MLYVLTITSGIQEITNFNGTISVTMPFDGTSPAVWHVSEDGEMRRLEVSFDYESQLITFYINGLYVIVVSDGFYDDLPPTDIPLLPPPQMLQHILRFTINQTHYEHNGEMRISDVVPFIFDDRAMVPLRIISEAIGADVYWVSATRTATITNAGEVLSIAIDEPLPDGMGTSVLRSNRILVPIRYVVEMLGSTVRWCSENAAVYVYQ